jgi:undecaprenyl-diphosphatase
MLAATDLGSTQIVTSISFGALFCFLLLRKNRTALLLALDMAVAVFVDTALKDAFHRARPQPFFDLAVPPSFSYPSGHAFFSMCCYGMLAILLAVHVKNLAARVAILIGGASLVLGIGISRIYLGVHYPSDVLGGWLLGLAWVCALLTSEGRFRKRVPESA